MRRLSYMLMLLFLSSWVKGQTRIPRVPSDMVFAGMELRISEGTRRDIQKDVDALWKSPKYIEIKADRARLYFPLIEKALKDAGVPPDFKYLALQESALISDAVSSANAVGFWQFKDFTGREVGLRIDKSIDERLNVVASTYGAAKYFKRNNFFFDNWIYTILAHMTGKSGAGKYVDKKNFGKKRMTLDNKTHWYVKRFLAHKIAYEDAVKGAHSKKMKLEIYDKGQGKTLAAIAKELKVDPVELKRYNKWLKAGKIPSERVYTVIVPTYGKGAKVKKSGKTPAPDKPKDKPIAKEKKPEQVVPEVIEKEVMPRTYPSIAKGLNTDGTIFIKINGLPCILAKRGDDLISLAKKAGKSPERLAKYNDMTLTDPVVEGAIYYLKPKRNKGQIYYHTVQRNETLWDVSQKFGIKLSKLAKWNRMMTIDELKAGRLLWLNAKRPESIGIEYRELPQLPVDQAIPPKMKEEKKEKAKPIVVEEKEPITEAVVVEEAPIVEEKPKPQKRNKDVSYHLVQKGETLYSISRAKEVSVGNLVEWNELEGHGLKIGQRLILHGVTATKKSKPQKKEISFHLVSPGDTVYGISRKYNIPVKQLLKMNQKDNFDLTIGEKLKVKED